MSGRRLYADGVGRDLLTSPSSRGRRGTLGSVAIEPKAGFEARLGDFEALWPSGVASRDTWPRLEDSLERPSSSPLPALLLSRESERARFLFDSIDGFCWRGVAGFVLVSGEDCTASAIASSGTESGISVNVSRAGS